MKIKQEFEKYKGFVFDLDGTTYRGSHIIPNADKTINYIKKTGRKVIFVTNKTTDSAKDYFNFLTANNLEINENEILTATGVIKKYLATNHPGFPIFALGEDKFINELREAGLSFSSDPSKIKVVIVTLDRTLNYNKLEIASKALELGALFLAANIDDTCPVDDGEILDAGSTISALEKRTHRKLELHFGKPSKYMFEEAMNLIRTPTEKVLLIGDRIETDIRMGNTFGLDTALVRTGVLNEYPDNSSISPTYRLNSIADLTED
ncbi:MAG: HAD-IIA family hydrolase [Ignavibacteriaceae bacterium]